MITATKGRTSDIASSDSVKEKAANPKPRVQSALRTIWILLAISESSNGLKVKDITDKFGLSRQVTYHLIHTLHATGMVRRNESGRYVLGLAAVAIAEGFYRQLALPEHLARRVRSIVAATKETAYAGGWVNGEIVAMASARGESPVDATQIPQGYSGHAHARAAGKLLLAMADPIICDAYLEGHPLIARTATTITNRDELLNEFQHIRERGYAVDHEEFHEGIRCLAVSVEGLGKRFVLGISVPSERFEKNFNYYLEVLTNAARVNF